MTSPELELLDQLLGGDLPLNVIADLFPDLRRCRQAVGAMQEAGEISILDSAGQPVPMWRYRELECEPGFWAEGTLFQMTITEVGAKRIG